MLNSYYIKKSACIHLRCKVNEFIDSTFSANIGPFIGLREVYLWGYINNTLKYTLVYGGLFPRVIS